MVFGPNMQNFAAIARAFVDKSGAVQVKDAAGLERELDRLLSDRAAREELGKKAVTVVRENLGAIDRTVEMIVEHLEWAR